MDKRERIELHCHSKAGGNATMFVDEIITRASEMGMPAIAITDTSSVLAFPEMDNVIKQGSYNVKPILGMEALVKAADDAEYNISVLVKNDEGKKALYSLLSKYHQGRKNSVFPEEAIFENRENLLLGTGTEEGMLYSLVKEDDDDQAIIRLLEKYDYAELLPHANLEAANKRIIDLCDKAGIPAVAVCDCHYLDNAGKLAYNIMRNWEGMKAAVANNQLLDTEQMLDAFSYLPKEKAEEIVVANTHLIADKCQQISFLPEQKLYPQLADAEIILREKCLSRLEQLYTKEKRDKALEILEFELAALIRTGMCFLPLMFESSLKANGISAGNVSFRGCASGSIVLYLLGITDTDPVENAMYPEFIYGIDGTKELDFAINLPTDMREAVIDTLVNQTGVNCISVGDMYNVSDALATAMIEKYEFDGKTIFEEGIRDKIKMHIAGNYIASGGLSSGILISPGDCNFEEYFPVISVPDGEKASYYFPYYLDKVFLKLYLLSHTSLDKLRKLEMLTGEKCPDNDTCLKEVMQLLDNCSEAFEGKLNGIPGLSMPLSIELIRTLKPKSKKDLLKIMGMLYGTNVWENNGRKLNAEHNIGLDRLIADREDVYEYILGLGIERKAAFEIAEAVRKGIASRSRSVKWQNCKSRLIAAGAEEWFIWSCEQIKYLFPRAHSFSYLNMAVRLGWYSIHYPAEFLAVISQCNE